MAMSASAQTSDLITCLGPLLVVDKRGGLVGNILLALWLICVLVEAIVAQLPILLKVLMEESARTVAPVFMGPTLLAGDDGLAFAFPGYIHVERFGFEVCGLAFCCKS